ncbi:MAG TPA: hypothetical protein VEJ20_02020 [Candidatus Eremiobacteraceae bacterium]|nr:hypothetical protein [Candidatus Eremiobacteraceae bacterium]
MTIATAAALAQGAVYTGQVIDLERGYVVFANGDALRLATDATVIDVRTNRSLTFVQPGEYGAATLDASGAVELLQIADTPFAQGIPIEQIPRADVVQLSPAKANQDLASNIPPITSKLTKTEVVTITAFVPSTTPFTDDVYITTDTSGWNPQAVKMARIDGRRFRAIMDVLPGTQFQFLFTRGSWSTVESDRAGLRRAPRTLYAAGAVALDVDATVQRWIDLP